MPNPIILIDKAAKSFGGIPTLGTYNNTLSLDWKVQIHRMVVEAFATIDGLQHLNEQQTPIKDQPLEDYLGNDNVILETLTRFEILFETMIMKASTPLYKGSSTSMLLTMLLLLNLRTTHVINNALMDELFSLLRKELLPKENKMPTSTYEAFKLVRQLD